MKLKKLTALLLCGALMLTGCSSAKEEKSDDLLATIKERGEIIVAMEGTWAPWTYHNEKDELVGYDTEVATLIAENWA